MGKVKQKKSLKRISVAKVRQVRRYLAEADRLSLRQIAQKCQVSHNTVFRLSQNLFHKDVE